MDDENGHTAYQYDAFGNVTQVQHTELGQTYTQSYQYDNGNRISRQTLPSGRSITYGRDGVRRINRVQATLNGTPTTLISQTQYRADHRMTQCTYGNGVQEARQYDQQGRLTHYTLGSTGSTLVERSYDYDANGNLIERQHSADNTDTQNYQYDALDRLTEEINHAATALNYDYDLNHNRLTLQHSPQSSSYQYKTDSNRLKIIETDQIGDDPLNIPPQRQMVYNDAGRLFQVNENNTLIATYTYNAFGQRTRKVTPEGTTVYHYDLNGQLIGETQADASPIRDYVRTNGVAIAQIDGNEQLSYLHQDHLATPRLATNGSAAIVWRWEGPQLFQCKFNHA